MTGNESGFRRAAARFSAEVEWALTRARRAARDARAHSAEFRQRTEELATQAKNGKLRELRRSQTTPTSPDALAAATRFRTDNGLPVPDLPAADELVGRVPDRTPPVRRDDDDFAEVTVLFDVDKEPPAPARPEPAVIDSPEPEVPRSSDPQDDFSQERILMDATVETYRPGEVVAPGHVDDDPEIRR